MCGKGAYENRVPSKMVGERRYGYGRLFVANRTEQGCTPYRAERRQHRGAKSLRLGTLPAASGRLR